MINILVVDDLELTHKLIETYLEPEDDLKIIGFASDGQTAIERVQELNPDVVLMDIEMPVMNGLTATEIIIDRFINTKVLILTAHDNEQQLSKAMRVGAKGYLLKNTSAEELVNAIRCVKKGYFQLSLELTEKYLYKIIRSPSELQESYEFRNKLNFLYQSLSKLESKLKKNSETERDYTSYINKIVENKIQQKTANIPIKDSHLQFKLDRMKYDFERLKKTVVHVLIIQIGSITFAIAIILYSIFFTTN